MLLAQCYRVNKALVLFFHKQASYTVLSTFSSQIMPSNKDPNMHCLSQNSIFVLVKSFWNITLFHSMFFSGNHRLGALPLVVVFSEYIYFLPGVMHCKYFFFILWVIVFQLPAFPLTCQGLITLSNNGILTGSFEKFIGRISKLISELPLCISHTADERTFCFFVYRLHFAIKSPFHFRDNHREFFLSCTGFLLCSWYNTWMLVSA